MRMIKRVPLTLENTLKPKKRSAFEDTKQKDKKERKKDWAAREK